MSNGANSGTPTPAAGQQPFLRGLFHQISAVTIVSVIGTLLVSYFQNISSYDDKVAALAEEDMAAATQAFTNMSSSLSTAVSLQQRLIGNFYNAICKDVDAVYKRIDPNCKDVHQEDNAYLTKSARTMYKDYMDTYADFHQKYNLLAQGAEIYLDWPSDPTHDAAASSTPRTDPLNMSSLGRYDFDCEKLMPSFKEGETRVQLKDKDGKPFEDNEGKPVVFDWNSAKHHVLATQYCFDVTHQNVTGVLQWASQSTVDSAQWDYLTNPDQAELFKVTRATNQVLRLNYFMAVAMSHIEAIRTKYRPNGYICSVPIVGTALSKRCNTPVRTAGG
jgi:hypothetical protein